jgi:dienelactone hydrolase
VTVSSGFFVCGLAVALWCVGLPPAVAQTTLEVPLAGRTVAVDVYRPDGPARGAVILSHGFTRSRTTLGGHAAALATGGILAITPDMPYTFDFNRNARGLAELVAMLRAGGEFGTPVSKVVLVGFSAGALSSLLAAGTPGVVGYVGLDPFDRTASDGKGALGLDFAPSLETEAVLLRAPPSRCNAHSVAAPWGQALPALLSDRVIEGASHCDFESPSDWMCEIACGATDPARQAVVRETLTEATDRWLPPATDQATDGSAR